MGRCGRPRRDPASFWQRSLMRVSQGNSLDSDPEEEEQLARQPRGGGAI